MTKKLAAKFQIERGFKMNFYNIFKRKQLFLEGESPNLMFKIL